MQQFYNYLQGFWQQPFNPEGSVLNWAMFILLLLVLIWIWTSILAYAKPIAEAAAEAV